MDFPISADYDLMLRFLGKYKISTAYLPEILVKMRTGGKSKNSLKNLYYKSLEDYRIIKNNNAGNIITLIFKKLSKLPQFLKK